MRFTGEIFMNVYGRESDALKCTESDRRPVCNLIVQRLCE